MEDEDEGDCGTEEELLDERGVEGDETEAAEEDEEEIEEGDVDAESDDWWTASAV